MPLQPPPMLINRRDRKTRRPLPVILRLSFVAMIVRLKQFENNIQETIYCV